MISMRFNQGHVTRKVKKRLQSTSLKRAETLREVNTCLDLIEDVLKVLEPKISK
jgi:hypothetical protein